MNHCPACGAQVEYSKTVQDIATTHTYWNCPRCGVGWEETVSKEFNEVIAIRPVEGGD